MGSGSGIQPLTSLLRFQGSDAFFLKEFKKGASFSLLLLLQTKRS